jgi:hypothetical protein
MKWLPLVCLISCATSDDIVGPFTGPVHRFVVDRFSLPVSNTAAKAIADDLDGDNRPDNQLGNALGVLAGNDNLTTHADDMLKSGAIASIIEIQADDLLNDPAAGVRYFGREGDAFVVMGGAIVNGVFTSNRTRSTNVPGRATLRLPVFADASPSVIVIDAMEIILDPDGATRYNVRIRGGVGRDVETETARGLIEMMEANPQGHPYALLLLDKDRDGVVTASEVLGNSIITGLLVPDVELRVDGRLVDRLSFGFGVHAIPCATGNCALGTPAATCFDRIVDGDESDVDCGGACRPCARGAACREAGDCQSQSCNGTCGPVSCSNGVHDGFETDVDCGWNCGKCATGRQCRRNDDCESLRCSGGLGELGLCS